MSKEKFRGKYRIESARLKGYDYASNGGYFITICTANRIPFFGEIIGGKMVLNNTGIIAKKYWDEIPQHFPFIILDAMVVMPNHIHGVLWIDRNVGDGDAVDGEAVDGDAVDGDAVDGDAVDGDAVDGDAVDGDAVDGDAVDGDAVDGRDVACNVSTEQNMQTQPPIPQNTKPNKNQKMAKISPKQGSISTVIRSYKSVVTKDSREKNPNFAWQPRFYDHIIRNKIALQNIRKYIIKNPEMWERDKNNKNGLWL